MLGHLPHHKKLLMLLENLEKNLLYNHTLGLVLGIFLHNPEKSCKILFMASRHIRRGGHMKYDEDWYYTPPEFESEEDEEEDSYWEERAWEASQYD